MSRERIIRVIDCRHYNGGRYDHWYEDTDHRYWKLVDRGSGMTDWFRATEDEYERHKHDRISPPDSFGA